MFKKSLLIVALLATAAGCSTVKDKVDMAKDRVEYREQPLVRDVKMGMTKEQVLTLGGTPSSQYTRKVKPGSCNNYVLSREGQEQVYSIGFDSAGRVDAKGFETCESADHY
ncbi:Beta-barrel assembly machine subunit BamE [Pseudomonas duriflava]|uniref:Beta-barrel assembly machine subunit BamE n=1 Tax=Pseudomonas duriflava TaxID=459528 RepID=A0A562QFN6_9PSED|nr:osmotically-inducible lipoprotein OsmE [Pseudomonas duriflava]TWI54846.1 Beta-barrel assembly machine subunit BamE [Pseudomonas duriflava]